MGRGDTELFSPMGITSARSRRGAWVKAKTVRERRIPRGPKRKVATLMVKNHVVTCPAGVPVNDGFVSGVMGRLVDSFLMFARILIIAEG